MGRCQRQAHAPPARGLGLPHLAVITTAFTFVLIFIFEVRPSSRVRIEQLPAGRVGDCSDVYRAVLKAHGCKIIGEHTSVHKGRVEFVYRLPPRGTQDGLHAAFAEVPIDARGDVDWDAD